MNLVIEIIILTITGKIMKSYELTYCNTFSNKLISEISGFVLRKNVVLKSSPIIKRYILTILIE